MNFEPATVIPVCYKCESPLKVVSVSDNGVETIRYQCTACSRTSASFLLGYIDPVAPHTTEPEDKSPRRAQFFSEATQKYKLRAKMQGLVDLKNDGPGTADESSPSSQTAANTA